MSFSTKIAITKLELSVVFSKGGMGIWRFDS